MPGHNSLVIEWDSNLGLSDYRVQFVTILLYWLPCFASPVQFGTEIEAWEENECYKSTKLKSD